MFLVSECSETSSKTSSSTKLKSNKSSHHHKETSSIQSTTTTSQIPKRSIPTDLLLPRSIADLSAKIQSVSFTAGTFGSITSTNTNDCCHLSSSLNSSTKTKPTTSTGQARLSINLTRKPISKTPEHDDEKLTEAFFNELKNFANSNECLNNEGKKDNQQTKKSKQQCSTVNDAIFR